MGLLLPKQTSVPLAVDRHQREAAVWRDPTSCWVRWDGVFLKI